MTSASELFSRRSRLGRAAPPADFEGLELPDDRSFHYISNRRRHHHRHDPDGCDPLRRAQHFRHISHRVYRPDREPVRLDQATRQPSSSGINSVSADILSGISHRQRFTGSDRLPGAVLLARERLLARLRGVPLSGNRLIDVGDWSTGWLTGGTPSSDLNSETMLPPLMREPSKKKPPGLTQEALDSLHRAVFSRAEGAEEGMPRASRDCSICLDGYREGDKLTCLPCGHKFHSACLDPWVRTCGDCPYCRSVIDISS
ncbi:probable E3 ubiquitin-protein ligase RHY1A isoform X2 [Vitis vinifera]|uniref:probable E3 ubiquitin-protein ligase RHY1A isoform X2 n=1 Tax=Vitis vinifera TaxID=29760 RepID=UPI00053F4BEF|nr:probable E3 ubiquitin-protein ligase RHY1A isoform X2 [Vitis vinifera]|eukprot:XP_010647940.1 PREDICTED: probable E3 ubiquitin-protein ligase RHY1A isoform X2 [Vitis vinifera]